MDRVYESSKDLHVRNTYVYVKVGDSYAYSDAGCTAKIKADALKDLFVKGIVVNDAGKLFKPTGFEITAGVASLTYAKPDGVDATKAVLTVLHSQEFAG